MSVLVSVAIVFLIMHVISIYDGYVKPPKLIYKIFPPKIVYFKGRYLVKLMGEGYLCKDGVFRFSSLYATSSYIERYSFKSVEECREALNIYINGCETPKTDEDLIVEEKSWKIIDND